VPVGEFSNFDASQSSLCKLGFVINEPNAIKSVRSSAGEAPRKAAAAFVQL
jgi:hypothetical protein